MESIRQCKLKIRFQGNFLVIRKGGVVEIAGYSYWKMIKKHPGESPFNATEGTTGPSISPRSLARWCFLCFYLITRQDNWITAAVLSQRAIFNQISTSAPSNASCWHESQSGQPPLLWAIISYSAETHSTVMITVITSDNYESEKHIWYNAGHMCCVGLVHKDT